MLKKQIRKSLIETKERKEKRLIEESLIKNRISIIFEGIKSEKDFKSLSEEKQLKLSLKFIQEVAFLQENGLIVEQNLGSLMQSLFGGWFGNLTQTIFEPMLQKLLIPLFGEGFFTNFLTAYLTSRPSDIIKSFNDCKLMTKLIAEGISEAIAMQVMKSKGLTGSGYSFIRNTMGDVLTGSEFISGVEKGLGNTVCSILGKFSNNAEKVVDKVKGSTADAAKTAVSAVKNKVNPAVS
jgi:hypothetical protein